MRHAARALAGALALALLAYPRAAAGDEAPPVQLVDPDALAGFPALSADGRYVALAERETADSAGYRVDAAIVIAEVGRDPAKGRSYVYFRHDSFLDESENGLDRAAVDALNAALRAGGFRPLPVHGGRTAVPGSLVAGEVTFRFTRKGKTLKIEASVGGKKVGSASAEAGDSAEITGVAVVSGATPTAYVAIERMTSNDGALYTSEEWLMVPLPKLAAAGGPAELAPLTLPGASFRTTLALHDQVDEGDNEGPLIALGEATIVVTGARRVGGLTLVTLDTRAVRVWPTENAAAAASQPEPRTFATLAEARAEPEVARLIEPYLLPLPEAACVAVAGDLLFDAPCDLDEAGAKRLLKKPKPRAGLKPGKLKGNPHKATVVRAGDVVCTRWQERAGEAASGAEECFRAGAGWVSMWRNRRGFQAFARVAEFRPGAPPATVAETIAREAPAGMDVAILPGPEGLTAVSEGGEWRKVLVPGNVPVAAVDHRGRVVWFELRRGQETSLMLLDLEGFGVPETVIAPLTAGWVSVSYSEPRESLDVTEESFDQWMVTIDLGKKPSAELTETTMCDMGEEPRLAKPKQLKLKNPATLAAIAARGAGRSLQPAAAIQRGAPSRVPVPGVDTQYCEDCGAVTPIPGSSLVMVLVAPFQGADCGPFWSDYALYDLAAGVFVDADDPRRRAERWGDGLALFEGGWFAPSGRAFIRGGAIHRVDGPKVVLGEGLRGGGWLGGGWLVTRR